APEVDQGVWIGVALVGAGRGCGGGMGGGSCAQASPDRTIPPSNAASAHATKGGCPRRKHVPMATPFLRQSATRFTWNSVPRRTVDVKRGWSVLGARTLQREAAQRSCAINLWSHRMTARRLATWLVLSSLLVGHQAEARDWKWYKNQQFDNAIKVPKE